MFCNKCGNALNSEAQFCNKCGEAKTNPPAPVPVEPQIIYVQQEREPASSLVWKIVSGVISIIVIIIAILYFFNSNDSGFTAERGMAGTWVRQSTTGNIPASTPDRITFRGSGASGSGEFANPFLGSTVSFTWNISNNVFYMSRIPGGEGTVGLAGTTHITINAARTRLTFTYPNGSTAVFTKR
jgi:hypothetical protein